MRHLLTLVSLLFVGSVWADDFNFNSPRAKAAMEKYQYDKEDLLRDLEAALKYERTEGELDEAIRIRDAIKALKRGGSLEVASNVMTAKTPLIVGVWKDGASVWIVRPDGTAFNNAHRVVEGRWKAG